MNGEKVPWVGLSLEPLDTLFFRDGRPFEAASRAASGLPMPQTVAGALRTWLLREAGCEFEKLAEAMGKGASFGEATQEQSPQVGAVARLQFRGPWFAFKKEGGPPEPLVPIPAVLRQIKGTKETVPLAPLKGNLPGWDPPGDMPGMRPLWHADRRPIEKVEGYFLTKAGLETFLKGQTPSPNQIKPASALFDFDRRTGIGVNPDRLTAEEGLIYGVSLLALKKDVILYAEVSGPEEPLRLLPGNPTPIPLGGEGRRAGLQKVEVVKWPRMSSNEGRTLLLLTTPGIFGEPYWRPSNLSPVAAAVSGSVAVSGWDLARKGPKPTRFGPEAGSVYFLDRPLDPPRDSLCEGEDAALGWGTFVEGVWNYA